MPPDLPPPPTDPPGYYPIFRPRIAPRATSRHHARLGPRLPLPTTLSPPAERREAALRSALDVMNQLAIDEHEAARLSVSLEDPTDYNRRCRQLIELYFEPTTHSFDLTERGRWTPTIAAERAAAFADRVPRRVFQLKVHNALRVGEFVRADTSAPTTKDTMTGAAQPWPPQQAVAGTRVLP